MTIIEIINEEIQNIINENNNEIICYHRSNDKEHMIANNFNLELANNDNSVFGKAIYFASSSDITYQLGKYICKFKIKLENPLNLNIELSNEEVNNLFNIFKRKYKVNDVYDFNENYDGVQYGEFFLQIQDMLYLDNINNSYKDFIENVLGYKSFYHYSDYGTNFITNKGEYGYCYGLYNTQNIKFIDGPY